MTRTPLILISDPVKAAQQRSRSNLQGLEPDPDYLEVALRLGGQLIGYDLFDTAWYRMIRRIEKQIRLDLFESIYVARQLSHYNLIYSTSEKLAIPMSALLSITNSRIPHVVFAHKLSSGLKTQLFDMWPLYKQFCHIISDCSAQLEYAVNKLDIAPANVSFLYRSIDHRFYYPTSVETENYILAVGQEQRDYQTLLEAVKGINTRLVIVASSPWSTFRNSVPDTSNITVLSHISYCELRALYAKARLVVVPLFENDYAAGNTALLEAMAMAKPVIVTHTSGIQDYIVPNETGIYTSPQCPAELREAILSLLSHPTERIRLGTNARQVVEEEMNLDVLADKTVQIINKAIATA